MAGNLIMCAVCVHGCSLYGKGKKGWGIAVIGARSGAVLSVLLVCRHIYIDLL